MSVHTHTHHPPPPLQIGFTVLPGSYKCGTKYDLFTSMTFNFSDPALKSDLGAFAGKCGPVWQVSLRVDRL